MEANWEKVRETAHMLVEDRREITAEELLGVLIAAHPEVDKADLERWVKEWRS